MARRGNSSSSIYVSTDPNNIVPIGTPGEGVAIGRLGVLIFQEQQAIIGLGPLITEDIGDDLITEDTGVQIITEDTP